MTRIPLKTDGVDILHDTEINALINKVQTTNATNVDNEIAFARVFNVKNYGAKGDGVTDDSAAIQAAQDAITAAGSVLYFPASLSFYRTTATLNFTKSNTAVIGAPGVEIRRNSGTGQLFTFANNVTDVVVSDIKFHQVISPAGAFIAMGLGQSNIRINFVRCWFEAEGAQVVLQTWNGTLTVLAAGNVNKNVTFRDCVIDGTGAFSTAHKTVSATAVNIAFEH